MAQGYGILTLGKGDVKQLNDAQPLSGAPIACLGAGTGLGECFLTPGPGGQYCCWPSEGGHAEWAPRDQGNEETQMDLLKFLKIKYAGWARVSVERVVSGPGICNIYEYLAYRFPDMVRMHVLASPITKAFMLGAKGPFFTYTKDISILCMYDTR